MATTFTVGPGDYVRPYMQLRGTSLVRTFPEKASQTFVRGEPLIYGGTGSHKANQVGVAANDPTANIIGIACHGATGQENTAWAGVGNGGWGSRTDITALAAGAASSLGPGVAGNLGGYGVGGEYAYSAASTATLQGNGLTKGLIQVWLNFPDALWVGRVISGATISADNIGAKVGFEKDTVNLIWRVDDGDSGNASVQIVGLFDADGDINGRYIFKFVAATDLMFGER